MLQGVSEPHPSKEVARTSAPRLPVAVPPWQRWVAGASGIGLTAAGTYAVVLGGHDGLGSVALVLSGVFLGLFAVIGRLPNRIWGKDMGIEFLTTERAEELMDEIPRNKRQEIVNALVNVPTASINVSALAPSIQLTNAAAEAEMFEMACDRLIEHEMLPQIGPLHARRITFKKSSTSNPFRDAVVDVGTGDIVLQYRLRLTRAAVRKSAEFVKLTQDALGRPQGMIILVKTLDMDSLIEASVNSSQAGGRFYVIELPSAESESAREQILRAFEEIIDSMPDPIVAQ